MRRIELTLPGRKAVARTALSGSGGKMKKAESDFDIRLA